MARFPYGWQGGQRRPILRAIKDSTEFTGDGGSGCIGDGGSAF